MENNFDCLLLASGGMDSTVLAYKLAKENKNVVILFIDYGQHCKDKEYQTLLQVLPEEYVDNVRVIKIGDVYKESNSRMIIEANLWEIMLWQRICISRIEIFCLFHWHLHMRNLWE